MGISGLSVRPSVLCFISEAIERVSIEFVTEVVHITVIAHFMSALVGCDTV